MGIEKFREDLARAQAAPGTFGHAKSFTFNEPKNELVIEYQFRPPFASVVVRLTSEYILQYPVGSVSMMLGSQFLVVPAAAGKNLASLAQHIFDLASHAVSTGGGMGAPMATADGSMDGTEDSWSVEPTLEYGGDGQFQGLNSTLREEMEIATSLNLGMTLQDMPAIGKAVITVPVLIADLLTKTDCEAYSLVREEPLLVRLTVDRSLYKAGHLQVQVGQLPHFKALAFPQICNQMTHILNTFVPTFLASRAGSTKDPLELLVELGYDETTAAAALRRTEGDINLACGLLADESAEQFVEASKAPAAQPASTKKTVADEPKPKTVVHIRSLPATQSLFKALEEYTRQRLPAMAAFCVICDRPHVFSGSNMMMPSVCSRELCVFRFQKLDVARDAATSIAIQTGVVDLLVNIAIAAAKSSRWDKIFQPFPTVVHPTTKTIVMSQTNQAIGTALEILNKMPTVGTITSSNSVSDLRRKLEAAHPLANSMFEWIVQSNKCYIVKLPEHDHFKVMGTKHQYLFVSSTPERHAQFNALKAKHGSLWAFHGSRSENWHSILRNGLKNASGTALQVNGTAYGNGIYLSPNASTSFGYSNLPSAANDQQRQAHMKSDFIDPSTMMCIAVCEVVNFELRQSGSIWVQPHEHCVLTRFLFVYTHGFVEGYNTDLTHDAHKKTLSELTSRYF